MATTRVTMPQLGESVHEGTISKWLVKPGDRVVEFEPMLEVDTDKVNAEVPAPVTGVLKEILANEGETVQAGSEIAVVELEGDAEAPERVEARAQEATPTGEPAAAGGAGDAVPSRDQAETADAEPRPSPGEKRESAAREEPARQEPAREEPARDGSASEERPAAAAAEGDGSEGPEGGERADQAAPAAATEEATDAGHRYSPAVLMLAEEHGVDLSQIRGSGLGGRVTKRDVRQFVESQDRPAAADRPVTEARPQAAAQAPAQAGAARQAPAAVPPAQGAPAAGDEAVPLSRMRRLIAENMTRSKTTIPHAWQTQEVDMSGVVANRNANKAAFQQREGFSLTYLPYVLAAAISALRERPEVNATFNDTEVIVHRAINLGVSVGFEDTLLVPVIRNADSLSLAGLARAVNDLVTRARNRQLKADELQGGTFTVNNSGTFGTLFSYSVINPGQAGILTMEAIVERPVAVEGMIGIKPMMYLCFSFDHRVLDGLQGARFLTSCRKWLEAVGPDTPL
jgi:2-oxoisovalerate dehydrogenase E2 component (dihydrolipoyl transacylase)